MNASWFNSPERIVALQAACESWLGTPFRENSAAKGAGGGVSCHNLVAAVYFETGALARVDVPRGRARAMTNRVATDFLQKFDAVTAGRMTAVDPAQEPILPGDTLIICDDRGLRHLGVATAQHEFVHVAGPLGVIRSPLADAAGKIQAVRRPLP